MSSVVFHICSESDWAEARTQESYTPARYDVEGFIHLSKREQILRPANLLYTGRQDLILLVVDVDKLSAELIHEPGSHGEAELFPHLYGPLNCDAVITTVPFPCSADGSFDLPEGLGVG